MKNKQDGVGTQTHYEAHGIEPIDYIVANQMNFLEGNVIKYVTRYKLKNGLEDLLKAQQYLTWLINEVEAKDIADASWIGFDKAKENYDVTVVTNVATGVSNPCKKNETIEDCVTRIEAAEVKNAMGLDINPHHKRRHTDKN